MVSFQVFLDRYKITLCVYHGFFEELIVERRKSSTRKIMKDVKDHGLRKFIMSSRIGGSDMDRIRKSFGIKNSNGSLKVNLKIKSDLKKIFRVGSGNYVPSHGKIKKFSRSSVYGLFANSYFLLFNSKLKRMVKKYYSKNKQNVSVSEQTAPGSMKEDSVKELEQLLSIDFKRASKRGKTRLIEFFISKQTAPVSMKEDSVKELEQLLSIDFKRASKRGKTRLIEFFISKQTAPVSMPVQNVVKLSLPFVDHKHSFFKVFGKSRFAFYRAPKRISKLMLKMYRYRNVPKSLTNLL